MVKRELKITKYVGSKAAFMPAEVCVLVVFLHSGRFRIS